MPSPSVADDRRACRIPAAPGTYALVLRCPLRKRIRIGRLGVLGARPGFYVYVGSALGAGGVRARVGHHGRTARRPRWHIDYLRARASLLEVWWALGPCRREHDWAASVSAMRGAAAPLAGFGASDCACGTHLYYFQRRPTVTAFRARLDATSPVVHRTSATKRGPSSGA